MGEGSLIQWTDHTFNPWWGCTRVSPGCERCYAETLAHRYGHGWGPQAERRLFGEKHWNEPRRWNRAADRAGVRELVFCASMADVFEARPELDAERTRLWSLIEETPSLAWQLLTKRPGHIAEMVPAEWMRGGWPSNAWIGTSVEGRDWLPRIETLREIPARVRFVSFEPLLEDLGELDLAGIHWAIFGGESGPLARPCKGQWILDGVERCLEQSVRPFVKQLGSRACFPEHRICYRGCPEQHGDGFYRYLNGKGDDWNAWPEELRMREFPL